MFQISPQITRNEKDIGNAQFLFRITDEYYHLSINSFSSAFRSEHWSKQNNLAEWKESQIAYGGNEN